MGSEFHVEVVMAKTVLKRNKSRAQVSIFEHQQAPDGEEKYHGPAKGKCRDRERLAPPYQKKRK